MDKLPSNPWSEIDLSEIAEEDKPALPSTRSPPKRQQALVDAISSGDTEGVSSLVTPSKIRSAPISQALGENFSATMADILFQAGWLNPEVVWGRLFENKNWEGISWWMSKAERIVALENSVGTHSIRKVSFPESHELGGSKSLLGWGSVWEDIAQLGQASPNQYFNLVIGSDWGTLLRGGAHTNLQASVLETVITAAGKYKDPPAAAIKACERMFQMDAIAPPTYSTHKKKSDSDLKYMSSCLMLPFIQATATLEPVLAARVQRLVDRSIVLSSAMNSFWALVSKDPHGHKIGNTLASFGAALFHGPIAENVKRLTVVSKDPNPLLTPATRLHGWLDYMICSASPSVLHVFSAAGEKGGGKMREKIISRMMDNPNLFIHLCSSIPNDRVNHVLSRLLPLVREINPKGSSFAHLALAGRPTIAMAEIVSRISPPIDLINAVDENGLTPISFIDPTQRSSSLINRLGVNYSRASRSALKVVAQKSTSLPSPYRPKPNM